MSDNTDIQQSHGQQQSLMATFASKFGVEPEKMSKTLKATAFKQAEGQEITNEQMMALVVVANEHNLNPWTSEIYAFPSNGGVVPIVGVDGWARIINQHPEFDGMHFDAPEAPNGVPEWMECTIYRKDRSHPIVVREYFAEVTRPTKPWKSHPRRMLRHKTMIQCARLAFSFTGIYDQDEGERIVEGEVVSRGSNGAAPSAPAGSDGLTDEQAGQIAELIGEVGEDREALLNTLGVDSVQAIPQSRYPHVLQRLLDKRQAAQAEDDALREEVE